MKHVKPAFDGAFGVDSKLTPIKPSAPQTAESFADVLCEVVPVQADPDAPPSQLWRLSRNSIRGDNLQAGAENRSSFQIQGGEGSNPPVALSILLMSPDGATQVRAVAQRSDASEFVAVLRPPLAGPYYLLVQMPDNQEGRPRWDKVNVQAKKRKDSPPKGEVQFPRRNQSPRTLDRQTPPLAARTPISTGSGWCKLVL